jgi:hypothetical protein
MKTKQEVGKEFISHYGVRGMRWGQRKPPPAPVPTSVKSVVPQAKFRKTKIMGEGGHNHPAAPDALKVASTRQKLKKSGTDALSNQELREVAERMNLEQQVVRLERTKPPSTTGKKAVGQLLKDPKKTIETTGKAASELDKLLSRRR